MMGVYHGTILLVELNRIRKIHPDHAGEEGASACVEVFPTRTPSNHPTKSDRIWYFQSLARSGSVFQKNGCCLCQVDHDPVAEKDFRVGHDQKTVWALTPG